MAFHIVTSRCFLACEKVTSVLIEELDSSVQKMMKKSSKKKVKLKKANLEIMKVEDATVLPGRFAVVISFYPLSVQAQSGNGFSGSGNSRSDQENTLEIRVNSRKEADKLFKEIIKEVQEQHPNEAYLDKLVGELLEGDDVDG